MVRWGASEILHERMSPSTQQCAQASHPLREASVGPGGIHTVVGDHGQAGCRTEPWHPPPPQSFILQHPGCAYGLRGLHSQG